MLRLAASICILSPPVFFCLFVCLFVCSAQVFKAIATSPWPFQGKPYESNIFELLKAVPPFAGALKFRSAKGEQPHCARVQPLESPFSQGTAPIV